MSTIYQKSDTKVREIIYYYRHIGYQGLNLKFVIASYDIRKDTFLVVLSLYRKSQESKITLYAYTSLNNNMGVEVTGLHELNGRNLELLYGIEKVTVEKGELITRIKPLEVKVFATSRRWETAMQKGRDFQK